MKLRLVSLAAALLASQAADAQLAFPGAQGLGRNAVGGRNGEVYKVTNLNDSGEGSLRDAVSEPNRIVVFDVAGVIEVTDRVIVASNIYIAGQTAPGDGITVYGNGWSWSDADDSIVRYIRIRMGRGGDSGADAVTIASGSNMIFDHVTVSWGRDETFSISGDGAGITVQDSIIAQGLWSHSCGGLMQTDGGVSILRNLYIDNHTRNPKVKGVNDFQNNLVYNWGGGGGYIAGDSSGQSYANIINNYFITGPNTTVDAFSRGNENFHAYVQDNYLDDNRDGTLNGSPLCQDESCYSAIDFQSSPYDYPGPDTLLATEDVVEAVLASAGASLSRDTLDAALVAEVRSFGAAGSVISDEAEVGWPVALEGGDAPVDTDGDGIPDSWETENGLDPEDPADAMAIASNGYANLENYVNSLV